MFNFKTTCFTQSGQINEKLNAIPEDWDENLKDTTHNILEYHKYIIEHIAPNIPTYFIRFEDLRVNPQETLENVFKFLFEVDSLDGLNIQRRITEIVNQGHKASVSYKQKIESHDLKQGEKVPIVFNRHLELFTEDQREHVASNLKDYFQQFNYCEKVEGGDLNQVTPVQLEAQQTNFKFARYTEIDDEKAGLMDKLNAEAMQWVQELKNTGESKVFATNVEPGMIPKMSLPVQTFMKATLKTN